MSRNPANDDDDSSSRLSHGDDEESSSYQGSGSGSESGSESGSGSYSSESQSGSYSGSESDEGESNYSTDDGDTATQESGSVVTAANAPPPSTSSKLATMDNIDAFLKETADNDKQQQQQQQQQGQSSPVSTSKNNSTDDVSLLILISNQSLDRRVQQEQHHALTILDAQHIPYATLDGADPGHKEQRNQLFDLSGMRAEYPQFFLVRGNFEEEDKDISFYGNMETFLQANEEGWLAKDLGITVAPPAPQVLPPASPTKNNNNSSFLAPVLPLPPQGATSAQDNHAELPLTGNGKNQASSDKWETTTPGLVQTAIQQWDNSISGGSSSGGGGGLMMDGGASVNSSSNKNKPRDLPEDLPHVKGIVDDMDTALSKEQQAKLEHERMIEQMKQESAPQRQAVSERLTAARQHNQKNNDKDASNSDKSNNDGLLHNDLQQGDGQWDDGQNNTYDDGGGYPENGQQPHYNDGLDEPHNPNDGENNVEERQLALVEPSSKMALPRQNEHSTPIPPQKDYEPESESESADAGPLPLTAPVDDSFDPFDEFDRNRNTAESSQNDDTQRDDTEVERFHDEDQEGMEQSGEDTQRGASETDRFLDEEQGGMEHREGDKAFEANRDVERAMVAEEETKQIPCAAYIIALLFGEAVGVAVGWYLWVR